ncbi:MAG TPA: DUF5667 domain-containing protein [Vitreimonas sp.]|nr:DUF5667 domain-containing protein [Vitreimonas sp.]
MWKHTRLLLSTTALLSGGLILWVSLSSVPTVFSANGTTEASKRSVYMEGEILPDHLAYPVLMAVDRVKLETAAPHDQVFMKVEYGNRRIEYAQELIDKDNTPVALSTLTKALKYLHKAGQTALEIEAPDNTKQYVIKTLDYHHQTIEKMKSRFPDPDRVVLDQLQNENLIMKAQLHDSMSSSLER